MRNLPHGIAYQCEELAERRRLSWHGVSIELVRVPPVAHAYKHQSSSHLLMFTERGTRTDGESKADGEQVSTLRDTSATFSVIPAHCGYAGWTEPKFPAEYLSIAVTPNAAFFDRDYGVDRVCQAPRIYVPAVPAEVFLTLEKLKRALRAPDEHGMLYAQTLTSLLMMEVFRWQVLTGPAADNVRGGLAPWQERRTKEFVLAHLNRNISLDELAAECQLSASHFARAFRKSVGLPPHQWLLERRVDRAKDLLRTRSVAIAEVGLACGFGDQSHFTRTFSRFVGQSPAAWRRVNAPEALPQAQ